MKVLVIGNGGREHALVWKISQSSRVSKIFCAPGNAGTSELAENIPIKADDIEGLLTFAQKEKIDLTVVGPELPLTLGLVDRFEASDLRVFGPNRAAAVLEGSKAWTKDFLKENAIPTAAYENFDDFEEAVVYLKKQSFPVVIKADGLAAGKGVVIAQDEAEAVEALDSILRKKIFGAAGASVVIEDFLEGEEASFLAFVDGETVLPMDSAQDHKRIFDGDQGPNTGGMGVYSPAPVVTESVRARAMKEILEPTLRGLKKKGIFYKGVLYAGLMIDKSGAPKLLEYNVRFGDPETQALMIRLKTDFLDVADWVIDQRLKDKTLTWEPGASITVVLAAEGYPGEIKTGAKITGLKDVAGQKDLVVFHAGTKQEGDAVSVSGGRVLGVTALGVDLKDARRKAYAACERISWPGMQYRKDIGLKGIIN